MNFHDSERIAGLLEARGYRPTDDEREADVVVINTCSVRERAEDKLYSRLGDIRGRAAATGRRPTVAVTGCVAQQEGQRLLDRAGDVDVVVGTQALARLPELLEGGRGIDVNPHDDLRVPLGVVRRSDPVRAWVNIIEGCNEFCAFCVVPYTRGHERMRPAAEILAEVRLAADAGRREVQLLGQIVNHYQAPDDPGCDFAELLSRVSDVGGIERVRFASPHPRHVTDRLIAAMRDLPKVCKHLHLPVQSGSDQILKQMRRRYTRQQYFDLVDRLRDAIPDVTISTDLIVGFPGETAGDFDQTLDLVRRVRFHSMFSFKYSPRPNTLASKRLPDDVPEAEKTRRILAVQELQRGIQLGWHTRMVGSVYPVLADSVSRRRSWEMAGRTSGNVVVNFPGRREDLGRLLPIRVIEAGPHSVRGEVVHAD